MRQFKFPRTPNGNPSVGYELRIEKTGDCWIWRGSISSNGYGIYQTYKRYLGTSWAHRVAYILKYGEIPKNLEIMHNCDNKLCVNPEHLSLGTHQENENGKLARGRTLQGVNHPQAKLTKEQVQRIKVEQGTYKEIAKRYNTSPSQICNIRKGNSWKSV